jgi:hypothetical protein
MPAQVAQSAVHFFGVCPLKFGYGSKAQIQKILGSAGTNTTNGLKSLFHGFPHSVEMKSEFVGACKTPSTTAGRGDELKVRVTIPC